MMPSHGSRARRGDANRDRLRQARGHRFVPHGDGQVADAHNHRVGAILVARRGSTPSVHSEVGGDERRAILRLKSIARTDRWSSSSTCHSFYGSPRCPNRALGRRKARRVSARLEVEFDETTDQPPIRNIFVPHTGQVPSVAGLPFFMVIVLVLHLALCLALDTVGLSRHW